MSGDGSPSWAIIQLLAANTPPGFSTRKISRKIASLSGTCSNASLENTTSKSAVGKRQRTRRRLHEIGAIRQPALCGPPARRGDDRALDVEARHVSGAVPVDQMQRNAAGAAADVEHMAALERQSGDDAVDFLRPARRQIALAPQRLQETDRRVVILGQIDAVCAHRMPFSNRRTVGSKPSASTGKRNRIC